MTVLKYYFFIKAFEIVAIYKKISFFLRSISVKQFFLNYWYFICLELTYCIIFEKKNSDF